MGYRGRGARRDGVTGHGGTWGDGDAGWVGMLLVGLGEWDGDAGRDLGWGMLSVGGSWSGSEGVSGVVGVLRVVGEGLDGVARTRMGQWGM